MYMKEGRRGGGEREENSKQEQRNPHCRNHSTGLWVGWGGASRVKFNRFSYLVKCPRAAAFCCSWVKLVAQQGGALSSSPLQGMWGASSGGEASGMASVYLEPVFFLPPLSVQGTVPTSVPTVGVYPFVPITSDCLGSFITAPQSSHPALIHMKGSQGVPISLKLSPTYMHHPKALTPLCS